MVKKKIQMFLFLAVFAPVFFQAGWAGEHPGQKVGGKEETKVKQAATTYIDNRVKEKGNFEVEDAVAKKTWKLKFDYFHTINKLDNGDYFFCADFTEGTDRLDLDFTVSGADMKVKNFVIHKVNGKKR